MNIERIGMSRGNYSKNKIISTTFTLKCIIKLPFLATVRIFTSKENIDSVKKFIPD